MKAEDKDKGDGIMTPDRTAWIKNPTPAYGWKDCVTLSAEKSVANGDNYAMFTLAVWMFDAGYCFGATQTTFEAGKLIRSDSCKPATSKFKWDLK